MFGNALAIIYLNFRSLIAGKCLLSLYTTQKVRGSVDWIYIMFFSRE